MRANLSWRIAFLICAASWGGALLYSSLSSRALYADGALYVLIHFQHPYQFDDYDSHRSFASFIAQSPLLAAQRFGAAGVASYAAMYSLGAFVFPALCMLTALFLSRGRPLLFAANLAAITVFGFGTNFINSEAFALVRVYEGMLLVGPILAVWALVAARRAEVQDRIGLVLSSLLFSVGVLVGMGGVLSPRDLGNASNFLLDTLQYLRNPQSFMLLAVAAAFASVILPRRLMQLICVLLSFASAIAFLWALMRIKGYYAYTLYYQNRTFLVLLLAAAIGALFVAFWRFPQLLDEQRFQGRYAALLIPVVFAVAGDILGTYRWNSYLDEFCAALRQDVTPEQRIARLKDSGAVTGWSWSHPSLSVLLRDKGSGAMVTNESGGRWEPFDPSRPPSTGLFGVCEAPLLGEPR